MFLKRSMLILGALLVVLLCATLFACQKVDQPDGDDENTPPTESSTPESGNTPGDTSGGSSEGGTNSGENGGETTPKESEGLMFALSEDGASYTVTGIGTCTDTALVIPATHEGKPVTSIGGSAFYGCTSLVSITIPSSVTSIGNSAFYGCNGLESIAVQAGNTKYQSAGNCLIETASKTLIAGCKNSIIPTDGSVTNIGDRAFEECMSLVSITIPSSVTSIGEYAFMCPKLVEVYNLSSLLITKGGEDNGYVGYFAKDIYTDASTPMVT